jgi:hypothetical protein
MKESSKLDQVSEATGLSAATSNGATSDATGQGLSVTPGTHPVPKEGGTLSVTPGTHPVPASDGK